MAVPKKLTIVFLFFYAAVIIYVMLILMNPQFLQAVVKVRNSLANITEGSNYFWALLISFGICFLGSASVGFPVPFPFVLFSLSNSVYLKYLHRGLVLKQILESGPFWMEILGLALAGGLGCALGEFTGYAIGFGAKKVAEESKSELIKNINGFGKVVLENKKYIPIYVFIFAATPLPDDILFLPLGLMRYPFWKCILPGWAGKTLTTLFYCSWPILIALGFMATGVASNEVSTIITEALMLLITITVMFFIMSFDWTKYLEKRKEKKSKKS